ncbi:MAG TPA: histidine phosphatase family protein [Hyphomicrobium sp.]|nr:histidine phosphatase family protein [Hyphomicrobium sp.]
MLTLLLLRHAKSSWDNPALADFDRPLAKRGQKAAPRMGAEIETLGLHPDLILCSSAQRTRETLDLVLGSWSGAPPPVVYDEAIYMASPAELIAELRTLAATSPQPGRVMMVGHNPGFEELAELLTGGGDPSARELMARKFPTCALAVITFEGDDWAAIGPGKGTLTRFITPAHLT